MKGARCAGMMLWDDGLGLRFDVNALDELM